MGGGSTRVTDGRIRSAASSGRTIPRRLGPIDPRRSGARASRAGCRVTRKNRTSLRRRASLHHQSLYQRRSEGNPAKSLLPSPPQPEHPCTTPPSTTSSTAANPPPRPEPPRPSRSRNRSGSSSPTQTTTSTSASNSPAPSSTPPSSAARESRPRD